jgi:hypothetical protein
MITITIQPSTPAQLAAVTTLLQDYPVSTPLQEATTLSPPPKTSPRASSAKASPAPVQEPAAPKTDEGKVVPSLETVRAKLAAISQAGKKDEIAALIATFGASKLTEVKPENYADLLAAAEEL